MTTTINGIGTHFYGKERVLTHREPCEFCSNWSDLKSYDATKYFVFVFVPLIPLGKYRILDFCAHCQRCRQVKLKKWEEEKQKAVRGALAKLQQNPDDSDAIAEALAASASFQDEQILRQFSSHAEL